MSDRHSEGHPAALGSLRAAVLGADDGVVSTAALVLGVSTSSASTSATLAAGIAGLVAGSMSMAVGEWISVSSQRDAEEASIEEERGELARDPAAELDELRSLLEARGIRPNVAAEAARDLTAAGALDAHAVEELGLTASSRARPGQAAASSALSFAVGAAIPVSAIAATPASIEAYIVVAASLLALAILGWVGARAGHAPARRAVERVVVGGAAAMTVTALIGRLTVSLGL